MTKIKMPHFLRACMILAAILVFCRYDNPTGIFYPVFVLIIEAAYVYFCRQQEQVIKKTSRFYLAAALLLGISIPLTADRVVWFWAPLGIWLLFGLTFLHDVYDDRDWRILKYMKRLILLGCGLLKNVPVIFHFREGSEEKQTREKKWKYVALGLAAAIPMLLIVLQLLAEADLIFADILGNAFRTLMSQWVISDAVRIGLLFLTLTLFAFSAGYSKAGEQPADAQKDGRHHEPVVAITFTSLIALVYLLFCGIQVFGLFLGGLKLPENYTYAEYARQGFFQLLAVCIFNLILVQTCSGIYREHRALKIILTVISVCTYIMTASSAYRMLLYIGAYGLTKLRVYVLVALVIIALLMAGVVVNIFEYTFPLFRYGTAAVTVVCILLAFGKADARIAEYNIRNGYVYEYSYDMDLSYLYRLSADAVPVVARELRENQDLDKREKKILQNCLERNSGLKEYSDHWNLRTFNLSYWRGSSAVADWNSEKELLGLRDRP